MKLLLLLESEDLDVLCIQESWIAIRAPAPAISGYHVIKQRRTQGIHGRLATYFCQSLQLVTAQGN